MSIIKSFLFYTPKIYLIGDVKMKVIKYLLLAVVLLVLAVLLVAAFVPSEFGVERETQGP